MNLIIPDTLFEMYVRTCILNTHVYLKLRKQNFNLRTMKSTITQDLLYYKRSVYSFPVDQTLKPDHAEF